MTNWHNEVFEEMGWLLDANDVEEPEFELDDEFKPYFEDYPIDWENLSDLDTIKIATRIPKNHGKSSSSRCDSCGGINGLHGFSFDREGKY